MRYWLLLGVCLVGCGSGGSPSGPAVIDTPTITDGFDGPALSPFWVRTDNQPMPSFASNIGNPAPSLIPSGEISSVRQYPLDNGVTVSVDFMDPGTGTHPGATRLSLDTTGEPNNKAYSLGFRLAGGASFNSVTEGNMLQPTIIPTSYGTWHTATLRITPQSDVQYFMDGVMVDHSHLKFIPLIGNTAGFRLIKIPGNTDPSYLDNFKITPG